MNLQNSETDKGERPLTVMRAVLYSLFSGLLVVFAAPPFNLWPLAFVCLIPLYLAVQDASPRQSALYGLLMGTAMLAGGTYWWVGLLGRFANLSFASSLGLTLLFCIYQALPYALWAGLCSFLQRRYRISRLVSGPLVIVLAEMIVPFTFKMYLGITLWKVWPLIQIAEFGGTPAVSALLVLINLLLVEAAFAWREKKALAAPFQAGAMILAVIVLAGWGRGAYVNAVRDESPALNVGIVQPNFGILSVEDRKHKGEEYIKVLRKATRDLAGWNVDLLIWPETAWPYLLDRGMAREFPANHPWEMRDGTRTKLLLGTLSHTFGSKEVYNSAILLSNDGNIAGRYDKTQRVPFSEYIPFAKHFPEWAKKVREKTPLWPDIAQGNAPELLVDNQLRIGPLICSEDIDMAYVHKILRQKPNVLVSIVSDAWFAASGGAEQHLALAVFRAIEARRDLVRATNTGISAIVDATGRIRMQGPLVNVPEGSTVQPTLLNGEVKLLEMFGLAPYSARFMPLLCLLGLTAALISKRRGLSKGIADAWTLYDNSGKAPSVIARGESHATRKELR